MRLPDHTHPDAAISAIAEGQAGVVGLAQVLAELTYDQIRARVRSGHLYAWNRDVFIVGHRLLTPEGRRWAAVLACGAGAALSNWSCAVHRGLLSGDGPRMDVVVPTGRLI